MSTYNSDYDDDEDYYSPYDRWSAVDDVTVVDGGKETTTTDAGAATDADDDDIAGHEDVAAEPDQDGAQHEDGDEDETPLDTTEAATTSTIVDPRAEVRTEVYIVAPEDRITSDIMSRYEQTEYVSVRATQIENTGVHLLSPEEVSRYDTPIQIAKAELMLRRTVLVVRRELGYRKCEKTGTTPLWCEDWDPAEMTLLITYTDVI